MSMQMASIINNSRTFKGPQLFYLATSHHTYVHRPEIMANDNALRDVIDTSITVMATLTTLAAQTTCGKSIPSSPAMPTIKWPVQGDSKEDLW